MSRPFIGKRSGGHAMRAKMEGRPVDGLKCNFDPANLEIIQWRFNHARGGKIKQKSVAHYTSNVTTTGYRAICGKLIGDDVVKVLKSNELEKEERHCGNCLKQVKKLGY